VRTSWLVSGSHPNFVATMLRLAAEREVRVVDDQQGCPTMVDDLAPAAWTALRAGASGLLHLTNSGRPPGSASPGQRWPGPASTRAHRPLPHRRLPHPGPPPRLLGARFRAAGPLGLPDLPHWEDSLPAVVEGLRR